MIKEIKRRNGEIFKVLIDNEDEEIYNKYTWFIQCSDNTNYVRGVLKGSSKKKVFLHRVLLNASKNFEVDHINHNGLDNRRSNIRLCNRSENFMNKAHKKNIINKYKGAFFVKAENKWKATIRINGVKFGIGSFKNEIDAAAAYDVIAKKYYGEFACINNIDKDVPKEIIDSISDRVSLRFNNLTLEQKSKIILKNKVSIYRGVSYSKKDNKWYTRININGKQKNLGYSNSEKDAALLYNIKAKEVHGDKAILNKIGI